MSAQDLKSLCGKLWMSGRLCVEQKRDQITLRKRHYPVLCAIWCYGIFGGLGYFVVTHLPENRAFAIFFSIAGLLFATGFIAMAIYLDRRPPLLIYIPSTSSILIQGSEIRPEEYTAFRLGVREVKFDTGDGRTTGEALYVSKGDAEGIPIYVEHGTKHLRLKIEEFALKTGLPTFTLPPISV